MAVQPLLSCGPFQGLHTATEPYYLTPGQAANCSNVDVSYRLGAFSTAYGRTLLGTANLPAGFTIQCFAAIVAFQGEAPLLVKRLFVFSAINASGQSYQGWYDPIAKTTNQLSYAAPFTQAVQFGSALWTNGGDKIYFILSGGLASDPWQINVPY